MKHRFAIAACAALFAAAGFISVAQAADNTTDGFSDQTAKRSYALGMYIADSVDRLPVDVDVDALTEGLRDALGDGDTRLSKQESGVVYQALMRDVQKAHAMELQKLAQTNLEKSKAFLAQNKSKDGVKVTDSGLQYKIVKKGDGAQPGANDTVTVHYVGKLIDGTVFDSSRSRGKPATFPVSGVIPGWTEALQMMHEGAHYKLFIPPKLAYGTRGAGQVIGPNQALIFDVTLLTVHKK